MVEWMGASEWCDTELEQAEKAPPLTKLRTPRKGVATVVLDKYLKEARDTTAIESPEKLASEDSIDRPSPNSAGIQKMVFDKRKRLNNVFHRRRTLRRLVQITRLGILSIQGEARISDAELQLLVSSKLNDRQVRDSCGISSVLLAYNRL